MNKSDRRLIIRLQRVFPSDSEHKIRGTVSECINLHYKSLSDNNWLRNNQHSTLYSTVKTSTKLRDHTVEVKVDSPGVICWWSHRDKSEWNVEPELQAWTSPNKTIRFCDPKLTMGVPIIRLRGLAAFRVPVPDITSVWYPHMQCFLFILLLEKVFSSG